MISDKCDVITYYADGLTKALSTAVEFRSFLKNLKLMHANGWCINPVDGKRWQVFGLTPNKRANNTEYFELHVFSADGGTAIIELNDSEVTSFVDNIYTSDV
jgi:endoglucanase Acf2